MPIKLVGSNAARGPVTRHGLIHGLIRGCGAFCRGWQTLAARVPLENAPDQHTEDHKCRHHSCGNQIESTAIAISFRFEAVSRTANCDL